MWTSPRRDSHKNSIFTLIGTKWSSSSFFRSGVYVLKNAGWFHFIHCPGELLSRDLCIEYLNSHSLWSYTTQTRLRWFVDNDDFVHWYDFMSAGGPWMSRRQGWRMFTSWRVHLHLSCYINSKLSDMKSRAMRVIRICGVWSGNLLALGNQFAWFWDLLSPSVRLHFLTDHMVG